MGALITAETRDLWRIIIIKKAKRKITNRRRKGRLIVN